MTTVRAGIEYNTNLICDNIMMETAAAAITTLPNIIMMKENKTNLYLEKQTSAIQPSKG